MRRSTFALLLAVTGGIGAAAVSPAAAATTLCVGSTPGCFSTIQAAVDAAHDGDTVTIARGTFAGGLKIDVSVDVRGAGAGATIIRGGAPVVEVGVEFAPSEPTVSISGVTITGGTNSSVPDHAVTFGGGVRIPQAGSFPFTTGATVTIRNSVITGNTVASTELLPAGFCGPNDCSFASGGGISNDGALTLVNTRVTGNSAGASPSATVFANGGGIANSSRGRLTLLHSVVSGNVATATPPHGGGASAGGIASVGTLQIEDSLVGDNVVELSTTLANDAEPGAFAGGIDSAGTAAIARTIVHGNRIASANVTGDALGVGGGIIVDGTLSLVDSTVDHNSVDATASAPSTGAAIAVGGGVLVAPEGRLTVGGSRILGNRTRATNATGAAIAAGGGLLNNGATTMRRTLVIGNSATANGLGGVAQGGGIVNDTFGGSTPVLSLADSVVTANSLAGSPGLAVQGGGLFTTVAVSLNRTVIAGNTPDQCFGC